MANKQQVPKIDTIKDGVFAIIGTVNFDTVPKLCKFGYDFIDQYTELTLDLAKAEILDNSGLALLLTWLRYAKQHDKHIEFINAPQKLIGMAKLGGLGSWFPIK